MIDQRIEYYYKRPASGAMFTVLLTMHDRENCVDIDKQEFLCAVVGSSQLIYAREVSPSREDGKAALIAELTQWLNGRPYQIESKLKNIIERIEAL